MADTDPHSGEHSGESSISPSVLSELTARMIEALSKPPTSIPATDSAIAPIVIKLDDTNYALWSQVAEMYVAARINSATSMTTFLNHQQSTLSSVGGGLRMQL